MSLLGAHTLPILSGHKNLLALSGGVDSTALFHLLLEAGIAFEAALVNYRLRPESDQEAADMQRLCDRHHITLHTLTHPLKGNGLEAKARQVRYRFFEKLISQKGFDRLLTAHQLNDWLEWHLMQLGRGAGLLELCAMAPLEDRNGYLLYRPLLGVRRSQIEAYLQQRGVVPHCDQSNHNPRFLRNRIRHQYTNALMEEFGPGITRSFELMQSDRQRLLEGLKQKQYGRLTLIGLDHPLWSHQSALIIKTMGTLPSLAQRRALGAKKTMVVGRQVVVAFAKGQVWIAPFVQGVMPKSFKEACRQARVPPLVRPYLYAAQIDPSQL